MLLRRRHTLDNNNENFQDQNVDGLETESKTVKKSDKTKSNKKIIPEK